MKPHFTKTYTLTVSKERQQRMETKDFSLVVCYNYVWNSSKLLQRHKTGCHVPALDIY